MAFLPTKPAPAPYKSAPLTTHDLIMQQVRFEEAFLPHIEYDPQDPIVMRKELPDTRYSPVDRNSWISNIYHFRRSLI